MYLSYNDDGEINGYADSPNGMQNSIPAPADFDPATFDFLAWRVLADSDGKRLIPNGPIAPPPLTHYGFRRLLTLAEQIILDNFDVPEFAAEHPVLKQFGPIQKATLRTAMKAYETASEINLDDPGVVLFVGALAQMGLLEGDPETRTKTILAGYPPGGLPGAEGQ
ncbi:MAG: hypothetical protein LBO00_02590 [Zoogloeaceae bacterium]|jgi:hypothetical protein|nr:hypothetical protein [Zoogloeaceae bacterium]